MSRTKAVRCTVQVGAGQQCKHTTTNPNGDCGRHNAAGLGTADDRAGHVELDSDHFTRSDNIIQDAILDVQALDEMIANRRIEISGRGRPGMGDIPLPEFPPDSSAYGYIDPFDPNKFTPERQQLHDDIINGLLDGHLTSDTPTMILMGGGSGGGKSVTVRSGMVSGSDTAAHLDSDAIKDMLPEVQAMKAEGDDRWANFSHEESSYLLKRAVAAGFERKTNILVDGVGGNVEGMVARIEEAQSAGYRVTANYITVDVDIAIQRAESRAQRTGRHVPESVIRRAHSSANRAFTAVAGLCDEAQLIDTTNEPKAIWKVKDGYTSEADMASVNQWNDTWGQ